VDRHIVSASFVWAAGRLSGSPVEGPDEDGFTLAVEGIRTLPWDPAEPPLARLQVIGDLPRGEPDDFAEALGIPGLKATVRPGTPQGLWDSLVEATGTSNPGNEAIVIREVDDRTTTDNPARTPGVFTLGLAVRPGFRFLGHGQIAGRPLSADALLPLARRIAEEHRATAVPAKVIQIPTSPVHLGAKLADGHPHSPQASGPNGGLSGWAEVPVAALCSAMRNVSDGSLAVAMAHAESTSVGVFDRPGSPTFSGSELPTVGGLSLSPENYSKRPSVDPVNLSEGAYVPKATYLAERAGRWRLAADLCSSCGHLTFPSHGRCESCGKSDSLKVVDLPKRGLEVEATTVVHRGAQPTEFDRQVEASGNYEVVVARVAPGVRVTLQVTDGPPGWVRVGDRVDTVLRRLIPMEGAWRYGLKAIPAATRESQPARPAANETAP
jgi:uncharacterized OB-fold protein